MRNSQSLKYFSEFGKEHNHNKSPIPVLTSTEEVDKSYGLQKYMAGVSYHAKTPSLSYLNPYLNHPGNGLPYLYKESRHFNKPLV